MELSVIMPVYNERNTIKEIIKRVLAVDINKEIIIVDGYSTDGTREILERYRKRRDFKVIFYKDDKGKGSAVIKGLEYVTGDIVIIQDADLEYDPQDYSKLLKPFIKGDAEVVYGSRFKNKRNKHRYGLNLFGTKFLTLLTNVLYGSNLTDEPTCYKLFKTDVIKSLGLKCKGFEFCPEATAKVLKRGYDIIEIPIKYNSRTVEEGKKIKIKDGLIAAWVLLAQRVSG